MATRAERRKYLEGLSETEWAALARRLGDVALDKPPDKRIRWLLDAADRPGSGDGHDRAFGLHTDAEQQLQLQREGVETSKSAVRAAWVSAGCALLALIVAVIALVVALGE